MQATHTLTGEDKLWAALAHGSAVFAFFGPLLACIVWFTQRKKSAYARFHALQAMCYQVISMWAWIVLMPVVLGLIFTVLIVLAAAGGPSATTRSGVAPMMPLLFPLVLWGAMFAIFGLYVALGILGAGAGLAGRNFRYPLIGGWLTRYIGYSSGDGTISDEKEDAVASAVAHSTCVFWVMGLATPFAIWITQKDRSKLLGFQSLQAGIYQGLGAVAYFVLFVAQMLIFFGGMALAAGTGSTHAAASGRAQDLLFTVPLLCLLGAYLIGGFLYLLFGVIASIRVLRGHNFRYPILGTFLERRMNAKAPGTTLDTT